VLDLLVLILAVILNPRAKRRRRRALEAKEKESPVRSDVEAAVQSVSERQSNDIPPRQLVDAQSIREREDHLQSTRPHDHHHLHHIGRVMSKEEAEMSYSIDPVSAIINDAGEKETHEPHRLKPKEIV
jgi:hypothetical protein